jgi:hypothetical protein
MFVTGVAVTQDILQNVFEHDQEVASWPYEDLKRQGGLRPTEFSGGCFIGNVYSAKQGGPRGRIPQTLRIAR